MSDPAIDSLRAALSVAPDDATLRAMLAERLAARGRIEEAIEEYRTAVRSRPGDRSLRIALGGLFLVTENYGAAEIIANELIEQDPASAQALMLRSRALLGHGRAADARRAYLDAISIDPGLTDEPFAIRVGMADKSSPSANSSAAFHGGARWTGEPDSKTSEATAPGEIGDPKGRSQLGDAPAEAASTPGNRTRIPESAEGDAAGDGYDAEPDDEHGLLERPRIAFADVGGMEQLKEEIRLKILYPRLHPELYAAYGKKSGGGILLYGPPGCGKTHLARATAGELGATFISVGIADVLDMWIGSSERNLHRIFSVARSHGPCVLFFDEVDALAASRSDFKGSSGRHVINQFLAELDGAESSNDGVLVIGATNAPWHMDSAFRRPGRFDQIVFVPPPDRSARSAILRVLLRDRPAAGVDVERLAASTDGYSGADLQGIVDRAIEAKLAAAIREGVPRPIATQDLLTAIKGVRPTTREWFATVRNYVLYANEGGLYDPVRPYLTGR